MNFDLQRTGAIADNIKVGSKWLFDPYTLTVRFARKLTRADFHNTTAAVSAFDGGHVHGNDR